MANNMKEQIIALATLISTVLIPVSSAVGEIVSPLPEVQVLAEHELDLTNRLPEEYGNEVFAYNILLALEYLGADNFVLQPGEVFAFHSNSLPEFVPSVTMNSRFFMEEGYKSLAGLGGNGVCHLASLLNWTASNAGLEVTALANHSFAPVPGVPKEFGTSIRSQSKNQNLYIKNNLEAPVKFEFKVDGESVVLRIVIS